MTETLPASVKFANSALLSVLSENRERALVMAEAIAGKYDDEDFDKSFEQQRAALVLAGCSQDERDTVAFYSMLITMRRAGVSVRVMAKVFGFSKSSMYRFLAALRRLSQMGHAEIEERRSAAISHGPAVPNGTTPER